MKKSFYCLGIAMATAFLAGCVERRVVYVREPAPPSAVVEAPATDATAAPLTPPPGEEPPPAQVEVVPVSPGPEYVWVGGAWGWRGRWVWGPGHWMIGPHPHAAWMPGHWVRRGRRSFWIEGYWR